MLESMFFEKNFLKKSHKITFPPSVLAHCAQVYNVRHSKNDKKILSHLFSEEANMVHSEFDYK